MDWIYGQIVGFLGNFFALMGNMGVELFELEWVSAIILFFSRLAWALFAVSVVVCAFECGIEYSTGRGNLQQCGMNIIKGFLAVSLFTVVPVRLYENHGIDGRYTGPHDVAPTMSARYGTGGNNIPLVQQEEVICIAGNAIDRQPQNGGNGFGWQRDISYTLTTSDRHSVYARQRVDQFRDDEIASTESARQHKDATDLVCQPSSTWDADCRNLIRRLTPLECERLQGYPDGWTDVPGASDSARYKALGNSVAIPCVEHLMQRVAMVITLGLEWEF